ncbi:MAG: hypothetical protein AB1571_03110 [Nanoarchaeota archaeon]
MSKKAPNEIKLKIIKQVLKKYPNGIWIRELAKRSKLDKSLVSRYVNLYLKNEVMDVYKTKKPIRVVKLK